MDLKYIEKNHGYIIDRKFADPIETEGVQTYTTKGRMILKEILPVENIEIAKSIAEYAFDNMKSNILDTVKKQYSVSNDGIVNFYFEGNMDRDTTRNEYAKFKDGIILVNEVNFNLDFEIELKVTPKNFFKIQYENLICRMKLT